MQEMIDVREAQSNLRELLAQVLAGKEFFLTDGDTPIARVVPISPRIAGLHQGKIMTSDDFDVPLPDDYWTSGE